MADKLNIVDHISSHLNRHYKLAEDASTGEKLIVKFDKESNEEHGFESSIDKELAIHQLLDHPGIHKVLHKLQHDNQPALALEYIDAMPLSQMTGKAFDLRVFFQISLQLLETVNYIHKASWAHLSISPDIIWLSNNDHKVFLGEFSKAAELYQPMQVSQLKIGDFNPAYIPPEQTGRLSMGVDHRTDIYSLGLVFYLLLTGKNAFPETVLSKLIHYHLTVIPDPPHQISDTIPNVLSDIIIKMIAKNPSERYQSIDSLIADLFICQSQWNDKNLVESFQLAEHDVNLEIDLKENLIGREKEQEEILSLLYHHEITNAIVFVEGSHGKGKSSLLKMLQHSILKEKFLQQAISYQEAFQQQSFDAIFQIINNVIAPTVADSYISKEQLELELNQIIQKDDFWILDFIPNLKYYLDDHQQSISSGSQNVSSIKLLILQLLQLLANKKEGLVILLDDFHFADLQSRELIKELIFLKSMPGLYVLMAYNKEKLSDDHFMNELSFEELDKTHVKNFKLGRISEDDFRKMIFAIFHEESDTLKELSSYLYKTTNANLQFSKELLKQAYAAHHIYFNLLKKKWEVLFEALKTIQIPELGESYFSRIKNGLKASSYEILKMASVYGLEFKASNIAEDQGIELGQVQTALDEARVLGLVTKNENANWNFVSALVLQTSHEDLDAEPKSLLNARAALAKLEKLTEPATAREIFSVANHLLWVDTSHVDDKDVDSLVSTLLSAAKLAKQSYAFDASYNYFTKARSLVDHFGRGDLDAEQIMDGGVCAYLKGEFAEAENLLNTAKALFEDPYDKARVLQSMLVMNNLKGDLNKVFDIGVEALSYLGVNVGGGLSQLNVLKQLIGISFKQRGKKHLDYFELPNMLNKEAFLAQEILLKILTWSYSKGPEVMAQMVLKIHELTLKYGNSPISYAGYGGYGAVLSVGFGAIESGTDFALLGVEIAKKFEDTAYKFRAIGSEGATLTHRARSIEGNLKNIRLSLEKAIEFGDYSSYGPTSFLLTDQLFYLNVPLAEIKAEVRSFRDFARVKNYHDMEAFHGSRLLLLDSLDNKVPHEEEHKNYFERIDQSLFKYIASSHYCHEIFCKILTGSYETLDIVIQRCELLKNNNAVTILEIWYPVLKSLALIFSWIYDAKEVTNKQLRSIEKDLKFLEKLEDIIAENYKDYVSLMKGAVQLKKGAYLDAIKTLSIPSDNRSNNYSICEAWKNELLGVCYLKMENKPEAFKYISKSYELFKKWGANSKLIHLLDIYGQDLHAEIQSHSSDLNDLSIGNYLDVDSLIKASHILAEDINLDSLVRNLVKVIVENTGASMGMLFLIEEGALSLKEIYQSNGDRYLDPVDYENHYPKTVLKEVMQNQRAFVLSDAVREHQVKDPYIINNKQKSILCCPLIRLGKLVGISYLENNLLTGAFTKDRIQLIETISSQAALSIDNAAQYSKIIQLNKAYERFVPKEFIRFLDKKEIYEISLGDQVEKEMSVMFSDIRDFTTISEKMSPQDNFNFINEYLREMEPIVWKNGGFIDKFIGDSIMALFPNKPEDAINCAIQMNMRLQELNKSSTFPIEVGYGINTGSLMLGIIGGRNRMEGTVISDTVNLAARVESLTKVYKKPILITEDTKNKLRYQSSYEINAVDTVIAKGKTRPVIIYELKLNSA